MRTLGRFIGWVAYVVSDGPRREHRAFGEGFEYGQQVMADHLAIHMHTTPEEDCDA